MATSAVPDVIDALVSGVTTALADEAAYVSDGYAVTDDPGDFLMIGVEEPAIAAAAFSASSEQTMATMGTGRARDEEGTVTCAAYSWNGDGNQKTARDAVFSYVAAVETLLRTTPGLGVTGYSLVVAEMGSAQRLMQNKDTNGADALVIFTVRFRARL